MKEILIKLRTENRYTQDQIAKMLGITRQSYMKYENGDVEPTVEMIRKLSHFYSVSYEVLIDNQFQNKKEFSYSSKTNNTFLSEKAPEYSSVQSAFNYDYFSEQLEYLKEVIMSMQKKLVFANLEQKQFSKEESKVVNKINKEEFFKKYGEIKIDESFVDEWREMSLI